MMFLLVLKEYYTVASIFKGMNQFVIANYRSCNSI